MLKRLPIQPAGWVVLAVGLAGLLGALLLSWRELLVLAIGCAVVLLLSVGFIIGRSDVRLSRTLVPERVTVGEPALAELHVSNPGSVRTPRQTIYEAIDGSPVQVPLQSLKAGESTVVTWEPPTNRRGRYMLGPARITKADPCRLMQRNVSQTNVDELWVHPRVVPLTAFAGGLTKDMDGPTFDHSPAGDVAFHAIRPYRPGDDARHVHWMATARAGEMMVRHYVDNRQPYLSVLLDSNEANWASLDEFDHAVDIAASLAVSSLERAQPVSLHVGMKPVIGRQQRSTRTRLLDDLALADLDSRFDLGQAMTPLVTAERNTTVTVLITGTTGDLDLLATPAVNLATTCGVVILRVGDLADADASDVTPGRGVRFFEATDVYDFALAGQPKIAAT